MTFSLAQNNRHKLLREILTEDSAVLPFQLCLKEFFTDESIVLWCSRHGLKYIVEVFPRIHKEENKNWCFITFSTDEEQL